jgi:hypothetical protein
MSLSARPLLTAVFAFALMTPHVAGAAQPTTYRGSRLIATEADGWCSEARGAGGGGHGLEGDQLLLKAGSNPKKNELSFRSAKEQAPLLVNPDPTTTFRLLVRGGDGAADRSALVTLDPDNWKQLGKPSSPKGWKYKDKRGAQGGVRLVTIKNGQIKLKARGELWQFTPDGGSEPVSVHVQIGNQWYCSSFGGTVQKNDIRQFKARDAAMPASCPVEMCGNGVQDVDEVCDDGNLANGGDGDSCTNDCQAAPCQGDSYASTFEAVQSVVLDLYGCTSGLCHGQYDGLTGQPKEPSAHESGLVLLPASAANLPVGAPQGLEAVLAYNHDALLTLQPANNTFYDHFVIEGDSKTSLFYQALYKKTHCVGAANPPDLCEDLDTTVEAMPEGVDAGVDPLELEAIDIWIRAGAPLEGVVAQTADKLAACLPPATPQKIAQPPAPPAGEGVQLVSSAWDLPEQSENELCFPIYYDFTNLVPVDKQIDCPLDDEGQPVFGPNNGPDQKCFRWDKQFLLQDPQSHHSIIHIYTGVADTSDPSWGAWTKKPNDPEAAGAGDSCNPLDIDPALGFNPDCSGHPERSPACVAYGPSDFGQFGGIGGGGGEAPQFSGSQETHYEQELYEGVYSILPLKGIVVFNSHAFNLTDTGTTMNQYLNLWFADDTDTLPARQIFDAEEIFWKPLSEIIPPIPENFPTVPPFETREFCASFTVPNGANLFWLSSHTHRHGVRWRTWGPPNTPCDIGDAACVPPPNDDRLMYYSTVYNDPIQLEIDPPLEFTGNQAERTFLFCALYDNGSAPNSPPVKRASQSPAPPTIFGFEIGGPCPEAERACISPDPAKQGLLCSGEPDPDRFCDSSLGAFDGLCDACPVRGGFTTEDEMFILLGNYFVP